MKKVLILDIGCSYTKGYLFDASLHLIADYKVPTDIRSAEKLKACVREVISHFDKFRYEAIFPISFGESIIYDNVVYSPRYALTPVRENFYQITGTPTHIDRDIGSVFQTLLTFNYYDLLTVLPVSTYIASELCDVSIDTWELTHAANSGLFNLRQREWAMQVFDTYKASYLPCFNTLPFSDKFISPSTIVGKTKEGVRVFAGGHDHSCISVFDPKPIIIAGTWLVISYPEIDFIPSELEALAGVRWTITANGGFHKQMVMKVSNPITQQDMLSILKALDVMKVPHDEQILVIGGYGKSLAPQLNELTDRDIVSHVNSETYQHQQTAKYAVRALELS